MIYLTEESCETLKPGDVLIYTKTNPLTDKEAYGSKYPKEGERVTIKSIILTLIYLEGYIRFPGVSYGSSMAGYSHLRFAQPEFLKAPKNYSKPMIRSNVPSNGVKI